MSKKNYLFVKKETKLVSISLVIFFIGFFLGINFSDSNLNELQIELENSVLDLKSFSNFFLFQEELGRNICHDFEPEFLLNTLSDSALKLDELERNRKINNNNYELLKEKHNINQVMFYTYYKDYYENCDEAKNIILFFFNSSNNMLGIEQGEILDKVRVENEVIVLPMDYGYSQNLDYFYGFYNATKLPHLVINYNFELKGVSNQEEIEYGISLTKKQKFLNFGNNSILVGSN